MLSPRSSERYEFTAGSTLAFYTSALVIGLNIEATSYNEYRQLSLYREIPRMLQSIARSSFLTGELSHTTSSR